MAVVQNRTYYISVTGNDNDDGNSPETAWKTLEKVNSTIFQPGDKILFERGSCWKGQLHPKGSGKEEAPIIIDAYGDEKKRMPVIDGDSRATTEVPLFVEETYKLNHGAVVVLFNQDYWEINHLEVINRGKTSDDIATRYGILVRWDNYGTGKHVYVQECYVHNIAGRYIGFGENPEYAGRFLGDGIIFVSTGVPEAENGVKTNFDDILIKGNKLEEIYRTGITIWSQWTVRSGAPKYLYNTLEQFHNIVGEMDSYIASTNVVIEENILHDIAGDGILVNCCDGALIQKNKVSYCNKYSSDYNAAIWPHNSDNTIMQYNEVSYTQGTNDGQAFDVDFCCNNTLVQYNYSYNNKGGFLLVMEGAKNVVVRYNTSKNDECGIFSFNEQGVLVHNNLFQMTSNLVRKPNGKALYINNIFHGFAKEDMPVINDTESSFYANVYHNVETSVKDMVQIEDLSILLK